MRHTEKYLLGRMLSSYDAVNDAMIALDHSDFADEFNSALFTVMKMLYAKDCKIEPIAIFTLMEREFPKLANIENIIALEMYQYGDASEVKLFIEIIKEESRKKKINLLGLKLSKDSGDCEKKSTQLRDETLVMMEKIFSDEHSQACESMKELVHGDYEGSGKKAVFYIQEQTEKFRKGIKTLKGLPTGYNNLDMAMGGFCAGHYIIVGARPGEGKTTLCLNFIHNLLKKGIPVGFFSLEMTAHQCMMKLIGVETGLNIKDIEMGKGTDEDLQDFNNGISRMENFPLYIDSSSSLHASTLVARAKRMVMSHGIKILFVDYLGEIKGDGKFSSKQDEIQQVSRALRGLARDLHIPLVCVCQLNRESEKQERAPRKSDLRESGQIEADAHTILLLKKHDEDETENKSHNLPGKVSVHIVKNRFGEQSVVSFHFEGQKSKFTEIDYSSMRQQLQGGYGQS